MTRTKTAAPEQGKQAQKTAPGAIRLRPDERERLILEEATKLFAEHGFEASTPELASRLGVTQPLLYRYFHTKDELIRRVYEHVFPVDKLLVEWKSMLDDRTRDPRERLVTFYTQWATGSWVDIFLRLVMWARLTRPELIQPYAAATDTRLIPLVQKALYEASGLDGTYGGLKDTHEVARAFHALMVDVRLSMIDADYTVERVQTVIRFRLELFIEGLAQRTQRPARREKRK
ncbi:bacterial regulatory s, tetR family protein [Paraburkholderia xenovorans LB400]|uniref:Transcriptional regulator, TetR family n=1 Tax=Paraburkholderia xenovorans (strain LB400) TaxID=266265 RepID=Q13H92_PARXL|nr:TetR/AcrR family transcriptional regulator [Paraburkholderia xenovorans]ABE36547.1 transcriptional regulator, TetR family [Paraburkholderia xenovorans LB400]AIP34132.1 bacterial regulatory s, tetR family protein [Paraburkholderia xenovorans LB400]